jgi:hypothetical protein
MLDRSTHVNHLLSINTTDRVVNAGTFEIIYGIYTSFGLGYLVTFPSLLVVGNTPYT